MKIVCVSDLHLDAVSHGVPRFDEIMSATMTMVDRVQEGDVFVCLGDVATHGSTRVYEAIAGAIEIEKKVRERGASSASWLVGNHDVLEDGSGGNLLRPLEAHSAIVVDEPARYPGRINQIFLPHAPLSARYDPASVLAAFLEESNALAPRATERSKEKFRPTVIFGHLNPKGINPGSEAENFARGRDVMWPLYGAEDSGEYPNLLFVGGHIHRAQRYGRLWIVGSPVRLDFGEADHVPQTFEASFADGAWRVSRQPLEEIGVRLRKFVTSSKKFTAKDWGVDWGTFDGFVRAPTGSEPPENSTFVPLPALAEAKPKAAADAGAKKHRKVREVVLDVARSYPSAESGLLKAVEQTMTGEGL